MLASPASAASSPKALAIDREGDSRNPVKMIQKFIVRIFEDLTVPHP
jgi:hypothetical protein